MHMLDGPRWSPSSEDSWTETKVLFGIVNEVYLADAL
jgi:hypothetical protein